MSDAFAGKPIEQHPSSAADKLKEALGREQLAPTFTPIHYAGAIAQRDRVIERLSAENEKLRAAGEGVVKWWLDEGFDGAPYAFFALRKALGHSHTKEALKETGDD